MSDVDMNQGALCESTLTWHPLEGEPVEIPFDEHWVLPAGGIGEFRLSTRELDADGEPTRLFERIDCGQDGCPPTWAGYDADGYGPPPCPWCVAVSYRDAHAGCEHAQHGRWRSWKVTRWLAGWLYALGVICGSCHSYNVGCRGCVTSFSFRGSRPYVLGWPAWKWACVLRYRHWPGDYIGFDMCAKSLPCPTCQSRTAGHAEDCAEVSGG